MIGFQGFLVPTKWWGRVHQPPLFNNPPFCTEVYLARMFDLVFFLSMNFACMLEPCAPKKAPFCKNLFLYHDLSWAWNTLTQNLLLLRIPWKHFLQDGRLQFLSGKLMAFCICGFRPSPSMCWYTPIFLGRLWIYINILHCSKPCSPNIILQNGGVLAHFLKHNLDNVEDSTRTTIEPPRATHIVRACMCVCMHACMHRERRVSMAAKNICKAWIPYKMTKKSTKRFLTKWRAPTHPNIQTAFRDSYMIVILYLNHLSYYSYKMARCR